MSVQGLHAPPSPWDQASPSLSISLATEAARCVSTFVVPRTQDLRLFAGFHAFLHCQGCCRPMLPAEHSTGCMQQTMAFRPAKQPDLHVAGASMSFCCISSQASNLGSAPLSSHLQLTGFQASQCCQETTSVCEHTVYNISAKQLHRG